MRWLVLFVAIAGMVRADGEHAGTFDYYVLSLSWSPTWCALEGDARHSPQCAKGAGFGWVVHGFWPQYESGWPSWCPTEERNPNRKETAAEADLFGTSGNAWYQWRKHGVCSGLSSGNYYRRARQAWETLNIPAVFRRLNHAVELPPKIIEDAFLEVNPTMVPGGITVTCQAGRIDEVRICLTRGLEPRACGPDTDRDCMLKDALLDPTGN